MPVRSLSSPLLRWPDGDSVRRAAREWAESLARDEPDVRRAGYFGSYARRTEAFGSDLDLVVVLERSDVPFARRGALFDTGSLPVPADLLVYTEDELRRLLARDDRFARELREHAVWVVGNPPGKPGSRDS